MKRITGHCCAHVIYRASVAGGREEAQIQLAIDPTAATAADAWARFTSVYHDVDLLSLEIEVRLAAPLSPA